MNVLQDKVAIVTGAAGGIGGAIATRYAAVGAHVVVCDINAAGAEAIAAAISASGGSAIAVAADVSDQAQVAALFDTTLARFGRVDILVNNAAMVNTSRHFLEGDSAWWDKIIAVNLNGVYYCAQRAAQLMAAQHSGVIINMSSGGATKAHRGNAAYDAAKGGIEAMTRAMALDLGPYGVRVCGIAPGSIDTSGMSEELRRERGETIPLTRVGDVDDIAGPAVFLASDDARYITGHILPVDGGLLAQQRSPQVDIFPLSRFPKLG